jgi:hypothetical protein
MPRRAYSGLSDGVTKKPVSLGLANLCTSDHCFECKTNYAIVTAARSDARVGHWLRQNFANRALW